MTGVILYKNCEAYHHWCLNFPFFIIVYILGCVLYTPSGSKHHTTAYFSSGPGV